MATLGERKAGKGNTLAGNITVPHKNMVLLLRKEGWIEIGRQPAVIAMPYKKYI